MIHGLKPYPKYKDSGVPWLGDVPEHWEVRRLKSSVAHINEQTNAKNPDELYIALEYVESWTGRLRAPSGDVEFDSQVKRFRAGDVLFGKLRPYLAKVVRPRHGGVCVGEFFVLRPKRGVDPGYLEVALRSAPAIDFVNSSTYGAKMPRVAWTFVGGMLFPHPPISEQTAIVRFLDWADRRIRRVIRLRNQRIKLLEEYKQALINQAVTGKIDVRTGKPYPKYKNSGVEWLGEVPEHWRIVALKRLTRTQSGDSISSDDVFSECSDENPFPVIGGNGLMGYSSQCNVRTRVVVIGRVGALCGNIHEVCSSVWVTDNALVLTFREDAFRLKYLASVLRSRNLNELAEKTAQPLITGTKVGAESVPVPPLHEQTAIVEHLDEQTEKIDAAIAADRRVIDLLKEFRTRLVADVVTGKLDVREAAARLPDEPAEVEPDSEIDALESDETADTFENKTPEIA